MGTFELGCFGALFVNRELEKLTKGRFVIDRMRNYTGAGQ